MQEIHTMMYIDNEVLEKMIMTIVEGFDRIETCRCGQSPATGKKD